MKICHLSSAHPDDDTRIFRKECISLANAGHEVHLVVPTAKDCTRSGVHIHAVRKEKGRLRRMLLTAWRTYVCARKLRGDIYHFHDPELIPFGLLLKWRGSKVVYDAHEDTPRQIIGKPYIHPRLRAYIAKLFEVLEDYAAKRFDAIVTATPHIADRFLQLNPRTVDINNFPLLDEFEHATPWPDKSDKVCYVGGITSVRGALPMVQALQRTRARLTMAGGFQERRLEQELKDLPGWKQVDYRGFVQRENLRHIFAESCAGLVLFFPLPNHVDAQPNKMFEYMAAQLPVIASDFPMWREIIEGNQCGICVDPEKPDAIAEAIDYILEHPEQARRMGENGRQAVLKRYHWELEENKLISLYAEFSDVQ